MDGTTYLTLLTYYNNSIKTDLPRRDTFDVDQYQHIRVEREPERDHVEQLHIARIIDQPGFRLHVIPLQTVVRSAPKSTHFIDFEMSLKS